MSLRTLTMSFKLSIAIWKTSRTTVLPRPTAKWNNRILFKCHHSVEMGTTTKELYKIMTRFKGSLTLHQRALNLATKTISRCITQTTVVTRTNARSAALSYHRLKVLASLVEKTNGAGKATLMFTYPRIIQLSKISDKCKLHHNFLRISLQPT